MNEPKRPQVPGFGPEDPDPPPPPPRFAPESPDFVPEVPPPPPPPARVVDPDATEEIEPIRESVIPRLPSRPDVHDAVILDRNSSPFRASSARGSTMHRGVRGGLALIITGR